MSSVTGRRDDHSEPAAASPTRAPRVGARFLHAHQLDLHWEPQPGRRYADGPKRLMVITRKAAGTVWYRPVDAAGPVWRATESAMAEGGAIVDHWAEG